jgi:hypothetical protein
LPPVQVRPETTVLVTFLNVRDWMVPGRGAEVRAVRSKVLFARAVRTSGDTVVVVPLRLLDQRRRIINYPRDAAPMTFTSADAADLSTLRHSPRHTVAAVLLTAIALLAVASTICIMCDFGDGDDISY